MAGGRRPANFATTGKRHGGSDPAAATIDGYNIWQQPHTSPTAPYRPPTTIPYFHLPTGTGVLPTEPVSGGNSDPISPNVANALATALDTAVVAAVTRALSTGAVNGGKQDGQRRGACSSTQDDPVSSLSFNHVVGSSSRASSVSAGVDIAGVVELQVESEAQERKRDVEELQTAFSRLEARMNEMSSATQHDKKHVAVLEARVESAEAAARLSAATTEALQGTLKGAQRTLNDMRVQKRKADSDSERLRARVAALEAHSESMERGMESFTRQMSELRRHVESEQKSDSQDSASVLSRVQEALKAAKDAECRAKESIDSVSSVRSRMKKLESSSDASAKRAEKMSTDLALQSGAIDQLRNNGNDALVMQVQRLKKLVEANLRSHASSEGVVQSQAQLITRHVCVALREFIARRISTRITENNVLIDKTLRARVPAYAEGSDEFVLVRETELADSQSAESSLLGATAAGAAEGGRETSSVLPREVVDGFLDSERKTRIPNAV